MPIVSLSYHVKLDDVITVAAGIGDAQGGGHSIFLGTALVAQGELEVGPVELGRGGDLVGRIVVVSSVAVDIQPVHDHVSALVTLTGGHPDPMPIPQAADAPPNGAVSFLTIVTLVGGFGA